jgi:hypothetical protein
MARMQANLNCFMPLSLHAPGQRDTYATPLPQALGLPDDVWTPALKTAKRRGLAVQYSPGYLDFL